MSKQACVVVFEYLCLCALKTKQRRQQCFQRALIFFFSPACLSPLWHFRDTVQPRAYTRGDESQGALVTSELRVLHVSAVTAASWDTALLWYRSRCSIRSIPDLIFISSPLLSASACIGCTVLLAILFSSALFCFMLKLSRSSVLLSSSLDCPALLLHALFPALFPSYNAPLN